MADNIRTPGFVALLDEPKYIAVIRSDTLFFGARSFSTDGDVPENAGGSDFWIMKRNLDGSPIWSKTYGGLSNDDLEVVMPHPDGGVLGFGTTRTSQGLFGNIIGLAGGWLMRTNNAGSIIDGKIFGGNITETAVDAYRHISGDVTMAWNQVLQRSRPTRRYLMCVCARQFKRLLSMDILLEVHVQMYRQQLLRYQWQLYVQLQHQIAGLNK